MPYIPNDEDEFVRAERKRVQNGTDTTNNDVLKVVNCMKEYH